MVSPGRIGARATLTRIVAALGLAVAAPLVACGDDGAIGSEGGSGSGTASDTGGTIGPGTTGTGIDSTAGGMSQGGTDSSGTTGDPPGTSTGDTTDGSSGGSQGDCPGLGNAGLLYHSTLDDAAAVAMPAVGPPGIVNTTPMNDFVMGLDGGAVQIDAPGELVRVPQADNVGNVTIDRAQGTVDFCYSPNFDHTDGGEHGLWGTSDEGDGFLRARVSGSNADSLHLFALVPGMGFVEVQAFGTDYTMNAGEWYRITMSWDFVSQADPDLHIYLDGVELPLSIDNTAGNPLTPPPPDPLGFLEIGAILREPANPDWAADGIIDDFKVYDSALVP